MQRHALVLPLVQGLGLQQAGGGPHCGGGTLLVPVHVGHVVQSRPDCPLSDVKEVGNDMVVCDVATQLQVAVVD